MRRHLSKSILALTLLYSVNVYCQDALHIPRDTSYTVASTFQKILKQYPFVQIAQPERSGIKEVNDVVYHTVQDTPFGIRQLRADIFIPTGKAINPAVMIIHGGGWRSGDKSLNNAMARALSGNGFVVVSIEYRLSLEAKYPAAIQDVTSALGWMRKHAEQYNIDASRIALAGYSAGGQLASLAGVGLNHEKFYALNGMKINGVQAVIDLDGLLDFTNPESLAVKRTENSADVFWLKGFYEEIPERWREASPLNWVDSNSPPFLFINSSQTRFHAGCADMVEQLHFHGIYNEVHKFEDAPHSFWFFHPWFNPMIDYMTSFLNKVFQHQ